MDAHKVEIECPFDDEHSNAGDPNDTACFVTNGDKAAEKRFLIGCQHNICKTRKTGEFVERMISEECGMFPEGAAILHDPTYAKTLPITKEKQAEHIRNEVKRIADLVEGFTEDTDGPSILKAYQALAEIADDAPPGLVGKIVKKLGEVSGRTPAVSRKYLDAIVKGIREGAAKAQAEETRLADNKASGADLGKKPTLVIGEDDFPYMVDVTWKRLTAVNAVEQRYFEMGDVMVRFGAPDRSGRIVPKAMGVDGLLAELNQHVRWIAGERVCDADRKVAAQIRDQDNLRFPRVDNITGAPFFDADGSLVSERGYHAASRTFYQPPAGFELPTIPDHPTLEDVKAARELIEDHVLVDFSLYASDRRRGQPRI